MSLARTHTYINISVCQMFVVGERARTIYGFKIFWSKMLELMSKDIYTHYTHTCTRSHIYNSHAWREYENMSTKIQKFQKIWIDHTHTHTHTPILMLEICINSCIIMFKSVYICVYVFALFPCVSLSRSLSLSLSHTNIVQNVYVVKFGASFIRNVAYYHA